MANTTFDKSRLLRVVEAMASNIDWLLQPWLRVLHSSDGSCIRLAVSWQITRQVLEQIEAIDRSVIRLQLGTAAIPLLGEVDSRKPPRTWTQAGPAFRLPKSHSQYASNSRLST